MAEFMSTEHRMNPFPFYARMRRDRPVAWLEDQRAFGVFRHEDVRAVFGTPSVFSSEIPLPSGRPVSNIAFMDPPRHTRFRGIVMRAFTPQAIARLEGRIEAIAHALLDQVPAAGEMEVVRDFSHPLPIIVIAEMLGIPPADRDRFRRWSESIVQVNNQMAGGGDVINADAARREMNAYFGEIIARRRVAPEQDLVSGLVAAEVDGERLTEADILELCRLLLVAGNETTMHLIGNAVLTLLDHPGVLAHILDDPGLVPSFVEEVLRYRSPIQFLFRLVKEETTLAGQALSRGQMVWAFLGSANRDEAVFNDPDRFDLTRDPNPHIAFGTGIHFCLGAALSRLEARVALRALLSRFGDLARADDAPLEPTTALIAHGFARLPVRFRAR